MPPAKPTPPEVQRISDRVATPCASDWARCKLVDYAFRNKFVIAQTVPGGTTYRGTWAFADPRPWLWMWTDGSRQIRQPLLGVAPIWAHR